MKRPLVTAVLAGLVAARLGAGGVSIKGAYVEARTAEVFAGGCVINGEAATTGREALMAWKVDRGSFEGVSLNGLAVVAAGQAGSSRGSSRGYRVPGHKPGVLHQWRRRQRGRGADARSSVLSAMR